MNLNYTITSNLEKDKCPLNVDSLVFLGVTFLWPEGAGELPPLSPPDDSRSLSDGPAVTLKSQFSLDMRYSSCAK